MEVKEEFDEFLINDDVQMFSLGRNLKHKNIILSTEVITKALLKNNIYLLFRTNYQFLSETDFKLNVVGVFDNKNKKLYTNTKNLFDFEMPKSNYYIDELCSIENELIKDAKKVLFEYIDKNKDTLKNEGKELFDNILKDEKYKNVLSNLIAREYVFNVNSSHKYNNNEEKRYEEYLHRIKMADKTLLYLIGEKSKEEISKTLLLGFLEQKCYDNWAQKKYLGCRLLEVEYINQSLRKMYQEGNKSAYKKTQTIVQAIKNINAKFLTITLKCDNEEVTFKYRKDDMLILNDFDLYNKNPLISLYAVYISNKKERESVDKVLKGKEENYDNYLNFITEIKWGKKILYKEKW